MPIRHTGLTAVIIQNDAELSVLHGLPQTILGGTRGSFLPRPAVVDGRSSPHRGFVILGWLSLGLGICAAGLFMACALFLLTTLLTLRENKSPVQAMNTLTSNG